ncbi:MAG: hypothetical protein A2Y98_00985 [Candidatus Portnoybacteria bacterium RBG_19FT_COMBO_36_7]|uniref:Polymerase/histidinol phosphatase N-terminal domain-containing protein n=1 Tax=Candidatus Portnoybacteria bacterium RBG_19FT_COMBO_36_7 TaxID=1801992 RepID=A0A1G2F9R9_9BACT|nr:MAG: hypothetical protein A2Y98_00985 [Candidatus Portnoybacteria bacterium RBG_19FT_COMBO_36_7]
MKIKGFFHIHSIYSDGQLNLAELKKFFSQNGCSFIFVTEHAEELMYQKGQNFIADCQKNSDDKFLIIPGFEFKYQSSHILIINPSKYYEEPELADSFKKYKNDNCLIIWAHPFFKGRKNIDEQTIGLLDGCEIWNSLYDGKYCPRPSSIRLLKEIREKNSQIFGYAGLDLHRLSHAGGPCLEVEIQAFTRVDIINSLRGGNFIIKRGDIEINSVGEIIKGQKAFSGLVSFLSVNIIKIFKTISAIFAGLGIKPPKKAKELIRSKI